MSRVVAVLCATLLAACAVGAEPRDAARDAGEQRSTMPIAAPSSSPAPAAAARSERGAPAPGVKPGSDTTGPRTDDLEVSNGTMTITEPGAVVERIEHHGEIYVQASGVVLRDVRVISHGWYGIRVFEGAAGVIIEHAEVALEQRPAGQAAVASAGGNLTLRDSELRGNGDGVKIGNGDVYERNWIHMTKPDAGSDLHLDGLQADGGGTGVVIRQNRIELPPEVDGNAAIIINGSMAPSRGDILIEGNWLDGGNYTIYAGRNKDGSCQPDVRAIGNRFGRSERYGLLSSGDCEVTWRGNTFMDTGDPAPPVRAS
jgi:Right handed beta helix region